MKYLKISSITASIFLVLFTACSQANKPGNPVQSLSVRQAGVRIVLPANPGPIAQRASEILAREIAERSGAKVSTEGKADFIVELSIKPGIGTEGFTIADGKNGSVVITGNDENGLLYGIGKFLHTSAYSSPSPSGRLGGALGFTPGTWRGTSVPKGAIRGTYFATHMMNWYETASDGELQRYLEDMALWGTNALMAVFPSAWLQSFDDPKAKESLRKLNKLMCQAKAVGMKVGTAMDNASFLTTPKEALATRGEHCWGPVLVCPGKPEGMRILKNDWATLLNELSGPGINFAVYWPYDEGGCVCKDCAPWGSNGYPKMCGKLTKVLHSKYPKAKVILSTWLFDFDKKLPNGYMKLDFKTDGEYAGLDKYLRQHPGWADYLMVDAHEEFPEYPLKVGAPGGLPMINFPEVSMIGQDPWGAYGANPLPGRLQKLWNGTHGKVSGGFPYSEGIYEDLNKVICSQFYWDPKASADETVKEYIAYNYSPEVVDSVSKAIGLMEQNHFRKVTERKNDWPSGNWQFYGVLLGGSRVEFCNSDWSALTREGKAKLAQNTEEAFRLIDRAGKQLTPRVQQSWRWRILYLRAQIDKELVRTDGWLEGPVLKASFAELTQLYHGDSAAYFLHVPRIDDAGVRYSDKK